MKLNEWAATMKTQIYEELNVGKRPPVGKFDEHILREAQVKGKPQMGATTYSPVSAVFEFIFPDSNSSATVLQVVVEPPERIVFLPVPEWVMEEIWQGDVSGSPHFESEAVELMRRFSAELEPGANDRHFGPQPAKRRE
ncbi:MAG: hypothetical protein ABIV13_01070 [Fimbriimonadales bacterium]